MCINLDTKTLSRLTLYRDKWIWVLNKPANLLSVPSKKLEVPNLFSPLQQLHPGLKVVHRLDEPTSGVILFAGNTQIEAKLHQQFRSRQPKKKYLARVYGKVSAKQGSIKMPLARDCPNRPRQKIDFKKGKKSLTQWQLLREDKHTSRLELTPYTGRTHQLRVHLATIGLPIIGDTLYAPALTIHQSAKRLFLHAYSLEIIHPVAGIPFSFTAPCPF